ncbi:MAG: YqgE/AlgH family protein [Myxococcaceae bacterium]
MKQLAPGFLIAMPQLGDPNFHRTVVLMIEHNDEGSMGLVINRTSPLTLSQLGKGQKLKVSSSLAPQNVYVGGPVEPYRGFVLHDSADVEERTELSEGLYLSMTSEALTGLLQMPTVRLRFCLGYAGWGPKQIERELTQGAWLFTEAATRTVLDGDPKDIWGDTLKGMGVDPAMLMTSGGIH